MRWSKACCVALASCTVAACGARLTTDTSNDAGPDVSTAGSGGSGGSAAGAGGDSGTGGIAGIGGTAGTGTSGRGGTGGMGGASGDAGGGAGGASGRGGAAGTSGVGGASIGGASGAGGNGNAGGASGNGGVAGASAGSGGAGTAGVGGTAGKGGSTFDGGRVPCVDDHDCAPVICPAAPCPEALCVMREGGHQCVTRVHPPYGSCAGYPDSGVCCTDDAQCTGQARGYCIPYSYGPSCVQSLQIPPPPPGNRCVYDACTSDLECTVRPNGFCTADFPRTCIYGPCRTNDDCNRHAGGKCVLGVDCEWSVQRAAFCRYADDPCRANTDCIPDGSGSMACVPNDDLHGTRCKNIGIPPP